VLAPNIVLYCGLTILVKVWAGLKARKCDAVEICRACGGNIKARSAIGFAAANIPFGIAATVLCIYKGVRETIRGAREEENEGGRSRRNSGVTGFDGCGRGQ
jgi:hypothetical protein